MDRTLFSETPCILCLVAYVSFNNLALKLMVMMKNLFIYNWIYLVTRADVGTYIMC